MIVVDQGAMVNWWRIALATFKRRLWSNTTNASKRAFCLSNGGRNLDSTAEHSLIEPADENNLHHWPLHVDWGKSDNIPTKNRILQARGWSQVLYGGKYLLVSLSSWPRPTSYVPSKIKTKSAWHESRCIIANKPTSSTSSDSWWDDPFNQLNPRGKSSLYTFIFVFQGQGTH